MTEIDARKKLQLANYTYKFNPNKSITFID